MVFGFEKSFLVFLDKYKYSLVFLFITFLSIVIRYFGLSFRSIDMNAFLLPWYDQIKSMGAIKSLGTQVGDYNFLYQMYIVLITKINVSAIFGYKILSILFDYGLAVVIGFLSVFLFDNKNKNYIFIAGYSFTLFLPTVILNSAYWGQADSIYSFFAILSLLFLLRNKYLFSFISLGIAFGFKLQTVFILPVFLLVYLIRKNFSIFYFLLIPVTMYFIYIPSFIFGRSILSPISVYMNQVSEYKLLSSGINLWGIFGNGDYHNLHFFAIILTLAILTICLSYVWITYENVINSEFILKLTVWCIWTCVMFLPSMHERYGFISELLMVPLLIKDRRMFLPFILMLIPVLSGYSVFLFHTVISNVTYISMIYLLGYLSFSYVIFITDKVRISI
ncbi:hypothetical protein [Weissella koreensis]|uniref:hypothetical protein n=1 Tax=Weissella koreensis TaxID=165096 RepID=UPI000CF35149|nr:hypothetical protein [Weissella koreensis]AVH75875.1 hypothetical protein C4597_07540 [Weissella koreensis]